MASVVSDSPRAALARLKKYDSKDLSEDDRYYKDLLIIKARDKAYMEHTSDSLILNVLDYYLKHKNSVHYPEALYYGCRVYSDLGDYPTSLSYFQQALDALTAKDPDLKLKANIISNISHLLRSLRMYSEAIPYAVESIKIDSVLYDTINMAYDKIFMGEIYINTKEYDLASNCFKEALDLCDLLPSDVQSICFMNLAELQHSQGNIDSALLYIRQISPDDMGIDKTVTYSIASEIYLNAGVVDTAFQYADKLIHSNDKNNRRTGFKVLLSPELRKFIPEDSLHIFFDDYKKTLEDYVNSHEGEQAIAQNSMYNYDMHERKRREMESKNRKLYDMLILCVAMMISGILYALFRMNDNKKRIIKLQRTLYYITMFRDGSLPAPVKTIEIVPSEVDKETAPAGELRLLPAPSNLKGLRARLMEELNSLKDEDDNDRKSQMPEKFLRREIYDAVMRYLKRNSPIPDKKPLWNDLEDAVLHESRDFRRNLMLLSEGKIDEIEYRIALLIKCGFPASKVSVLIGRARSSVSYRRAMLARKIYGKGFDIKYLDDMIQLI